MPVPTHLRIPLFAAVLALATLAPPARAQDAAAATSAQTVAPAAPSTTAPPTERPLAGPRLKPEWRSAPVLLPGETEGVAINSEARRQTIRISLVALLLGIIILILLVN